MRIVDIDEMSAKKSYGLIIPAKGGSLTSASDAITARRQPAVFANDSDSDELDEENVKTKRPTVEVNTGKIRRQDEVHLRKALEEDSKIFEYDSIYDDMQKQKDRTLDSAKKLDKERKPKYIPDILKASVMRQKEYESRVERQQQKELEQEAGQFADKETFVTNAYKEKMKRLHDYEVEEKRREQIESLMDVTKQKDLSGFYRHFLNDNYGSVNTEQADKDATQDEAKIGEEPPQPSTSNKPGPPAALPQHHAASSRSEKRKHHERKRRLSSSSEGSDSEQARRHSHHHASKHVGVADEKRQDKASRRADSAEKEAGKRGHEHVKREDKHEHNRPKDEYPVASASAKTGKSRPGDKATIDADLSSSESASDHEDEVRKSKKPAAASGKLKGHGTEQKDKEVTKAETKEERLLRLKKVFARKHDDAAIAELRERYFLRKAARLKDAA